MALPLKKKLMPLSNRNHPGTLLNASGDLFILVHETGNTQAGADAEMHATFVANGGGSSNVSFHLTVDQDEAWQMMKLNYLGWHASDGCDNRNTDWGCFQSIAIETCVNDGNRYKDRTRKNLAELIAMIISGDPRIDFGGIDHKRFSVERIRTHHQSAYDKKWCPTYMLNDGYIPTLVANVRTLLKSDVPTSTLVKGDIARVTENLNVRAGVGTKYPVVMTLPAGMIVRIIGDDTGRYTAYADGYTWYNISGGPGWAVGDWLEEVKQEPVKTYAPRRVITELSALTAADREKAASLVLKNGVKFYTVWDEVEAIVPAANLQFAFQGAKETEAKSPVGTKRWVSHIFEADDGRDYYYDERANRLNASEWKRVAD